MLFRSGIVAAALAAAVAPRSGTGVTAALVDNVRHARSFASVGTLGAPDVATSPLAAIVAAFSPIPTGWWSAAAAAAAVAGGLALSRHALRHTWALTASASIVPLWLLLSHPSFAALVAASASMWALVLARPRAGDAAPLAAGLLVGIAALGNLGALAVLVPLAWRARRAAATVVTTAVAFAVAGAWIGIVARHASADDLASIVRSAQ